MRRRDAVGLKWKSDLLCSCESREEVEVLEDVADRLLEAASGREERRLPMGSRSAPSWRRVALFDRKFDLVEGTYGGFVLAVGFGDRVESEEAHRGQVILRRMGGNT